METRAARIVGMNLTYRPATVNRWDDLEELFGENGAYSNCWCTWWVLTARAWDETAPVERRAILHGLVDSGEEPGILAYEGPVPVGWVAVGPRQRYARMMSPRARVNGPLDFGDPGWVINCFYVPRGHRNRRVAAGLLEAAVGFAFRHGATYLVGHPIDVEGHGQGAAALYVGTLSMFLAAGFTEVERRGTRPVVRLDRPT
jgi:GNAT superfamily N-acetyltransferase